MDERKGSAWKWRLIRYAAGILLLYWGLGLPLLSVAGRSAAGTVTEITQTDDSEDGRTTWYTVSYRFTLPDGGTGSGFSMKKGRRYGAGPGMSEGQTMTVRYVPGLSFLNAAPWDAEPLIGRLLMAVVAILLIRPPAWIVKKKADR